MHKATDAELWHIETSECHPLTRIIANLSGNNPLKVYYHFNKLSLFPLFCFYMSSKVCMTQTPWAYFSERNFFIS